MDTNYGDTYTSWDRVGWFYKNKLRKSAQKISMYMLVIAVIVGLYCASRVVDTMTDNYINYQVQQQLND